jgi:hypothetical protein
MGVFAFDYIGIRSASSLQQAGLHTIYENQNARGPQSTTRSTTNAPDYSDLNDFTGFVTAALIDSKLTVIQAIRSADTKAITKIVHSIDT